MWITHGEWERCRDSLFGPFWILIPITPHGKSIFLRLECLVCKKYCYIKAASMTCAAKDSFMFMTPPSRPLPSPLSPRVWLSSISRSSPPPSPALYHFYRNQLPNNKLRWNFAKERLKFFAGLEREERRLYHYLSEGTDFRQNRWEYFPDFTTLVQNRH